MDALVHEAAAVLSPGASPGGLIVIALAPVPPHVGSPMGQSAEPSGFQRLTDVLYGFIEPVLMVGADHHARLPAGLNDGVGVRDGQGDGLLDDHVAPGRDAVQGDGGMLAGLRGDGHQLRPLLLQKLPIVRVPVDVLQRESLRLLRHGLGEHVAHGHEIQAVVFGRLYVVRADPSTADQRISHFILPPFANISAFTPNQLFPLP